MPAGRRPPCRQVMTRRMASRVHPRTGSCIVPAADAAEVKRLLQTARTQNHYWQKFYLETPNFTLFMSGLVLSSDAEISTQTGIGLVNLFI